MKLVRRQNYFIVQLDADDVREFNAREHTRIPPEHCSFAFAKDTHRCIRVLPHHLRRGTTAWERMQRDALNYARGRDYHGY